MKHKLSLPQVEQKLRIATLDKNLSPNRKRLEDFEFTSINDRIKNILQIINVNPRPATNMMFFVMYDISSNKVRSLIAKYLIRKGCSRVQRSIFLADLNLSLYEEIRNDLAEVQSAYDNNDSILIVPISEGYLDAMRIIGQDINIDIITHRKKTIFF